MARFTARASTRTRARARVRVRAGIWVNASSILELKDVICQWTQITLLLSIQLGL